MFIESDKKFSILYLLNGWSTKHRAEHSWNPKYGLGLLKYTVGLSGWYSLHYEYYTKNVLRLSIDNLVIRERCRPYVFLIYLSFFCYCYTKPTILRTIRHNLEVPDLLLTITVYK